MVTSQSFTGTTPDLAAAVRAAVETCLEQLAGDAQLTQASAVGSQVTEVARAYDAVVAPGSLISGDVQISTGEVRPVFVQLRIGG